MGFLNKGTTSQSSTQPSLDPEDKALLAFMEKFFKDKYGKDLSEILTPSTPKDQIPSGIFSTPLGPLEALVKYLKEIHNKSNKEIAQILDKAPSTISATYHNAQDKYPQSLPSTGEQIPLDRFCTKYSVLEAIVLYFRDECGKKNTEIAIIIGRDQRTIATIYKRGKDRQ